MHKKNVKISECCQFSIQCRSIMCIQLLPSTYHETIVDCIWCLNLEAGTEQRNTAIKQKNNFSWTKTIHVSLFNILFVRRWIRLNGLCIIVHDTNQSFHFTVFHLVELGAMQSIVTRYKPPVNRNYLNTHFLQYILCQYLDDHIALNRSAENKP